MVDTMSTTTTVFSTALMTSMTCGPSLVVAPNLHGHNAIFGPATDDVFNPQKVESRSPANPGINVARSELAQIRRSSPTYDRSTANWYRAPNPPAANTLFYRAGSSPVNLFPAGRGIDR